MKITKKEIERLISTCPNSLDHWTLEPLLSLAFLDPLISNEELSPSQIHPPISFPDFSIPLVHFDAEVPRDFESAEITDGDITFSCSGTIFPSEATVSNLDSQEAPSTIDSFLADVLKTLPSDYSDLDKSLFKQRHSPTISVDGLVEDYLSLCSDNVSSFFAPTISKAVSDNVGIEQEIEVTRVKEEQKDASDSGTEVIPDKLLHHSDVEISSHAILESSVEKLAPLTELVPDPAFEWPFELDTFQKQAILCLERNQSVLVAAHTSAGKTVVAEYACAMCKRRGSRAIYTSPIKALSNQKFRDFRQTFGEDVGLLTGDIKVATKSSILVMTTEILHNMLCNTADTIRDLEIVIMDEVHYMNDKERGHVWEQLMILLPQHVLLVLLSATLPNALEFADWLGRIRGGTTIHVCQTHSRPVPLEHFLYTGCDTATRENLYLVVNKDGKFSLEGYREAKDSLSKPKNVKKKETVSNNAGIADTADADKIARNESKHKPKSQFTGGKTNTPGRKNYLQKDTEGYNRSFKSDTTVWIGLIRMLQERELMPVIVFCFSRAKINNLVQCLNSIDLLNKSEKNEVIVFLRAAIGPRLKGPDKLLAQVLLVRNLAVRGIAIHHAGMLPLLKEVVEMLFQRGLVRILFATETFSMGVNMPARSVVFTAIQKHDGTHRRFLTAGEYTQMAGRAGRRGLDSTGTVIIMANNCDISTMPTNLQLQQMLLGQATKLASRFKITYSMILYLHRGNLQTPQELIHQSFMHASDLRYELVRKRQLEWLQQLVNLSTVPKQTPGSLLSKTAPVATSNQSGNDVLLNHVEVRCPVYPLNSQASAETRCVDTIVGYYLACHRWRELSRICSDAAGKQSAAALNKVFSPGRLVQLQLSTESVGRAAQSAYSEHFVADAGSKCVPNWITTGVVLEVTKICNTAELTIVTWALPPSPVGDCTMRIGGVPEEEDILKSGEIPRLAFTPFPPHLMPTYCPKSQKESESRLVVLTEVPLTALLGVSCNSVEGASHKDFREALLQEITLLRQQQMASTEGLQVVVQKKRCGDVDGSAAYRKRVSPLFATNEALFRSATASSSEDGGFESIPFWQHLGLEGPDVEEWMMLTQELSTPHSGHRFSPETPVCADLVAHLCLIHRTTRRRWAIGRLSEMLNKDRGVLFDDYAARVRVLEELGFLDKSTRSGCLTRKGVAACELQYMEVLLAEVLFDGSIIQLPPADIAALLSCFVCESGAAVGGGVGGGTVAAVQNPPPAVPKSNPPAGHVALVPREAVEGDVAATQKDPADLIALPNTVVDHLKPTVRSIFAKAEQLQRLQLECGVQEGEGDTRLNAVLVGAAYAWACGQPFSAIVGLAGEMSEGHTLRALQRLDELLRHVCSACRGLGDQVLAARIDAAHRAIHRDMVCAPSLYVATEIASSTSGCEDPDAEYHEAEQTPA